MKSRKHETPREQQIGWNLSGGLRNRGVKLQCLTGKEEMDLVRIGKLHDDELLLQLPESFSLCFVVQMRPIVF